MSEFLTDGLLNYVEYDYTIWGDDLTDLVNLVLGTSFDNEALNPLLLDEELVTATHFEWDLAADSPDWKARNRIAGNIQAIADGTLTADSISLWELLSVFVCYALVPGGTYRIQWV